MEADKLDHDGNPVPEASLNQLNSFGSAEISDICGKPQTKPRVGNQYQVEITPMITEAERLQLLTNPFDSGVNTDVSHMFLIGLPITIVWVKDSEDERRGLSNAANVGSRNSKGGLVINLKRNSSKLKAEPVTINLEHEKKSIPVKSYCPLPGSVGEPWSDADESSFLLGLYIYGKNFTRIMKFMEKKEMGEILSFYYGKFYKCDGYRRWSGSRRTRRRKCVIGHKIFTGWRQQELISRLLPHVPEESQNNLVEVSKAFAEGKTSLEAYISFLKSTVGVNVLVEAVRIGKGKEDLTGLAIDSVKTKQHFPVCPKIPTGQACSSLTPSDIIKFLTGGYRLGKARCNDIFWEAVWPRLLARGWHSEQPKNQGCATSKGLLVFLIPGVHKFSRRKLVKGVHYFDSVTDVLSKVASEPELLELETEENMVQDDLSDDQCHRYLKPQVSNSTCNVDNMKFTVVDTSSAREGKSLKIRELRPLPLESKRVSKNEGTCSEDSEDGSDLDASERPSNAEEKTVVSNQRKGLFNGNPDRLKFTVGGRAPTLGVLRYSPSCGLPSLHRGKFVDKNEAEATLPHKFTIVDTSVVRGEKFRELRYLPVDLTYGLNCKGEDLGNSSEDSMDKHDSETADIMLICKKILENGNHCKSISDCSDSTQNQNSSDEKKPKASIKYKFSRRKNFGDSSSIALPAKRRRLTACVKAETRRVAKICSESGPKELESCCGLELQDVSNNSLSQAPPSENLLSVSCSAEGPMDCQFMDMSLEISEKPQFEPLFDLNLPQFPSESKSSESLTMEVETNHESINANESCSASNTDQLVDMNPRRQSTRNRPLTTKALEALANGFLNMTKRSSRAEVRLQDNLFSNPSRRARSRIRVASHNGCASAETVGVKKEREEEMGVDELHGCSLNSCTVDMV